MYKFLLLTGVTMLISSCVNNLEWSQPTKDPRSSFNEAYEKCLAQHQEDKSKCDEYLGSHLDDPAYLKGTSEHPGMEVYH